MSTRHSHAVKSVLPMVASALLAACAGGDDGGTSDKTGVLQLGITDGPVEMAEEAVIEFTGVELKPRGGSAFSITFPTPKRIDLLDYQGTQRAMLLDGETIAAGDYEWMRLQVKADPNVGGDSYLMIGGAECELRIPSGDETGLKMIRGFTVWPGSVTNFTIDFDLRKSILQPPGQRTTEPTCDGQAYLLRPVLRLVNNDEIGAVSGTVAGELVGACPAGQLGKVYLFGPYTNDLAPVPDDIDETDADGLDPLVTANVGLDAASNYSYTIGYAPAGKYVAAYTCDFDAADVDADAPNAPADADEVVEFVPSTVVPVSVTAGQTTTNVNFVSPAP
jgi:hypothetical protein